MFIGPVFNREAVTTPRRPAQYVYRAVYATALLLLICTAWLVLAGTQVVRSVGEMARFGTTLLQILAPLQLALTVFFSAFVAASAVAQEKDRRTLVLLLMTRLNNVELVLGKLFASLLNIVATLAAGLPIFMLAVLFGGFSFSQVGRIFAVALLSALVAGSLGSTIALWREKTFQSLALTALGLVIWLGAWEAVHAGVAGPAPAGVSSQAWAAAFSPLRATLAAARPLPNAVPPLGPFGDPVNAFFVTSFLGAVLLNAVAISRVRAWNAAGEARSRRQGEIAAESIFGPEHDHAAGRPANAAGPLAAGPAEAARAEHVDARHDARSARGRSRGVWHNPVLWREMCTWAHGRKIIAFRAGYWLLFACVAAGLYGAVAGGAVRAHGDDLAAILPPAAGPLAPFFLVSMVILNALAVTSISGERDGRALDLLLATDITPREFIFGKLGGVLFVAADTVLLPMALCACLWWAGGISTLQLLYLAGGLAVLDLFAAVLGIHSGLTYANSRSAIGVSLGTVFFLFLGVVACLLMMISFSGSFQVQLAPFLAFILGGSLGLYVSLGMRNPSAAIGLASLVLPIATFYAITSFLLEKYAFVFLATAGAYGFAVTALLVPALYEFDVAMGRTTAADDD